MVGGGRSFAHPYFRAVTLLRSLKKRWSNNNNPMGHSIELRATACTVLIRDWWRSNANAGTIIFRPRPDVSDLFLLHWAGDPSTTSVRCFETRCTTTSQQLVVLGDRNAVEAKTTSPFLDCVSMVVHKAMIPCASCLFFSSPSLVAFVLA